MILNIQMVCGGVRNVQNMHEVWRARAGSIISHMQCNNWKWLTIFVVQRIDILVVKGRA